MSALSAQNVLWQSQMAVAAADAAAVSSHHPFHQNPSHTFGPKTISTSDLHTLQAALQQQQQTLHQQLQSFLMLHPIASQNPLQRPLHHSTHQHRAMQQEFTVKEEISDRNPTTANRCLTAPSLIPVTPLSKSTTATSVCSNSPPPFTSVSPPPFLAFSPTTNQRSSISPNFMLHHHQQLNGRLDLPADENIDLEELERFAKEFKQRRIKLGTQILKFTTKFKNSLPQIPLFKCFFKDICNQ